MSTKNEVKISTGLSNAMAFCKPAVVSATGQVLIPILSHYCVKGDMVFAFNEALCLAAKVKGMELVDGGLPSYLLSVFETAKGKDISIAHTGEDQYQFKMGRTKIHVSVLSPSSFLFDPTSLFSEKKKKGTVSIKITKDVLAGIKMCLVNVEGAELPQQLGITFVLNGASLVLYSSDNVTVSKYEVGNEDAVGTFIVLKSFCATLVANGSEFLDKELVFTKDTVSVHTASKLIWGRLVQCDDLVDFEEQAFNKFSSKGSMSVQITGKLRMIAERITAVVSSEADETKRLASLSIRSGKLIFEASGIGGQIRESIDVKATKDVPSAKYSSRLLSRALSIGDNLVLTKDNSIILIKAGAFSHLILPQAGE